MINEEILRTLKEEFHKSLDNLEVKDKLPRLLVIGRKKTGKNALVRYLFGEISEGNTEQYEDYSVLTYNSLEVIIYNLEEHHNYKETLPEILEVTDLLWYCSTAPLLLKKEWDFQVLLTLQQYTPTALVITSLKGWLFTHRLKKLKKKLDEYYEGPVYPAYIKTGKTPGKVNEEDWSGLLSWSISVIEDSLQGDFVASSVAIDNLDEKRIFIAKKVVPSYTSGAGVIGAVPVPFSDAMLLIPEQVAMTVHILKIYGLEQSGRVITGIISSTLLSQLGRLAAGSLVKILPGVGSVTGSVANGSIAASFTWALGMSVSELGYRYKKAVASGLKVSFEEFYKSQDIKKVMKEFKEE